MQPINALLIAVVVVTGTETIAAQEAAEPRGAPALGVFDATGREQGTRTWSDGRWEWRMRDGLRFSTPALQRWLASSDGRTLVGVGDPNAPERPFVMSMAMFRDGVRVARPRVLLDPESSVGVTRDGRAFIVGRSPEDRSSWFALAFDADGKQLWRHDLPTGLQARDPVAAAGAWFVRAHGLREEGRSGVLLRVDAQGVEIVMETEGLLELVGFEEADQALLRTRETLTLLDLSTVLTLWSRTEPLRPTGRHGYARLESAGSAAIAVLHSDVQRRGQPEPPVQWSVFDGEQGVRLAQGRVDRSGPLADARLVVEDGSLELRWNGTTEVIAWDR